MSSLVRMSVSIEKSLLERLERMAKRGGYTNRSEFVRDMVRQRLVEDEWDKDREVVGSLTLIYNHHAHGLSEKLTELQHDHHREILATVHVHLKEDLCAEVVLVRARAGRVRRIADTLRRQKGVLHADLSMSTTGAALR